MRRILSTLAMSIAALALILSFRTRDPMPPIDILAEPEVVVTTTRAPVTTTTLATTTTVEPYVTSRFYATTTTRTTLAPRPTVPVTTTTQAPLPTSPEALTFDGPEVDTDFGPIQVRVVVAGDVIEDVIPLALPSRYRTSRSISEWSWRFCRRRTLEAQSSDFRIVTGATVTWRAYVESLEVALELAGFEP